MATFARENAKIQAVFYRMPQQGGKPEKYMMVVFQPPAEILFGSSDAKSALIEVKSIGALEPARTKKITQEFCAPIRPSRLPSAIITSLTSGRMGMNTAVAARPTRTGFSWVFIQPASNWLI